MVKNLTGGYELYRKGWKIDIPYSSKRFVFYGTKEDAKKFAIRMKKNLKNPYAPKITAIR